MSTITKPKRTRMVETLTIAQIKRYTCHRCKTSRSGYSTWSICADGNRPRVLCWRCDVEMNWLALTWMQDPQVCEKMLQYIEKGPTRGVAAR